VYQKGCQEGRGVSLRTWGQANHQLQYKGSHVWRSGACLRSILAWKSLERSTCKYKSVSPAHGMISHDVWIQNRPINIEICPHLGGNAQVAQCTPFVGVATVCLRLSEWPGVSPQAMGMWRNSGSDPSNGASGLNGSDLAPQCLANGVPSDWHASSYPDAASLKHLWNPKRDAASDPDEEYNRFWYPLTCW